jgi:hypothetical protein
MQECGQDDLFTAINGQKISRELARTQQLVENKEPHPHQAPKAYPSHTQE